MKQINILRNFAEMAFYLIVVSLSTSCSNDDFFYDSEERPYEIAFSEEFEMYFKAKMSFDQIMIEDSLLSLKSEEEKRIHSERVSETLKELFLSLDYLYEKYPEFESYPESEKEELYVFAIQHNPNLRDIIYKPSMAKCTRANGDPENMARMLSGVTVSGFNLTPYDDLSSALTECSRIGHKLFGRYGTCGYSFYDNSAILMKPTNHTYSQEVDPPYPSVLGQNIMPRKLFFYSYASADDVNLEEHIYQSSILNGIWDACASINEVIVVCHTSQSNYDTRSFPR